MKRSGPRELHCSGALPSTFHHSWPCLGALILEVARTLTFVTGFSHHVLPDTRTPRLTDTAVVRLYRELSMVACTSGPSLALLIPQFTHHTDHSPPGSAFSANKTDE